MSTQSVIIVPLEDHPQPEEGVTALRSLRRVDKIYLVFSKESYGGLVSSLEYYNIKVNPIPVNNDDIFGYLEKYREIFNAEQGNDIFVNLSTGNKIASIAGMMACMLWKGIPYYVRLEPRVVLRTFMNEELPQSYYPIAGIDFLPVFETANPSAEFMKVLSVINEAGGQISKKTLIEKLQSPGYRLIPQYRRSVTKSAPHSRLRAILDPLEKRWRFVTIQARGRRSQVSLTEKGKEALRIFGAGKSIDSGGS
jgi:hypothetical protein